MSNKHLGKAGAARLPLTIAIAALAIAAGIGGADAASKLQETGSFDCSCSGGQGTCTFESSTDNTSCYGGPEDTCSGSCKLTMTPDKATSSPTRNIPGAAAKTGTKLKMKMKHD